MTAAIRSKVRLDARSGLSRAIGAALCLFMLQESGGVAVAASSDGYWLIVSTGKLNIRSRPDMNSAVMVEAGLDDVLRGVEPLPGWHKVYPPDGAFCYVSAKNVKATGNQGVVEVAEGSSLRVRIGSASGNLDPLQAERVALLPGGSTVEIISQEGDWYRIKPPVDVFAYVSSEYVVRPGPEQAAELDRKFGGKYAAREQTPMTRFSPPAVPVSEPASRSADVPREAEALVPIEELPSETAAPIESTADPGRDVGRTGSQVQDMRPLDGAIRDDAETTGHEGSSNVSASSQPIEAVSADAAPSTSSAPADGARTLEALPSEGLQRRVYMVQQMYDIQATVDPALRNWEPVLAEYRALVEQGESAMIAELARKRVREIERRMADDEFLRRSDDVLARHWTTSTLAPPPLRERVPVPVVPSSMPYHDARGILRLGGLPEGVSANVRGMLLDPYTGAVTAYVSSNDAELGPLEGRYLAIRGEWIRDPQLGFQVLQIEQAFVLPLKRRGM